MGLCVLCLWDAYYSFSFSPLLPILLDGVTSRHFKSKRMRGEIRHPFDRGACRHQAKVHHQIPP